MGISQFDPAARGRPARNAGRQVGAKRALRPRQILAIRFFLDREGRMQDRALFDLAIDSKLRGCDLVKIKIGTPVAGPEIRALCDVNLAAGSFTRSAKVVSEFVVVVSFAFGIYYYIASDANSC